MSDLAVFVRRPDLSLAGELGQYSSLTVNLKWNGVGSWTLVGTNRGRFSALTEPRNGLIVVDRSGVPLLSPSDVVISGDVEDIGPETWSADGSDGGPGTLTINGGDDLAIVADELAFPDPTHAVTAQTAAAYDARSGKAETVIKGYVSANVGTGRASARADAAVPNARTVTVATDAARGSTVSYQARFDDLLDVVTQMAAASSPQLGVRVQQLDGSLVFDVYEPVDRSAKVRFSKTRRNLRSYSLTRSMPTATHVVVAGQGEGLDRTFRERKDTAAANEWGRIVRTFVDQRSTNVTTELDQAGDDALTQGSRTGALSVSAIDTPKCRFGMHFGLGDLVAVELASGAVLVDRVTAATISTTSEGRQPTQITIGVPDLDPHTSELYALVKRLQAQINALQRSV